MEYFITYQLNGFLKMFLEYSNFTTDIQTYLFFLFTNIIRIINFYVLCK